MSKPISVFRIFIASPSDLGEEREALRDAVNDINTIFALETEWRIELLGWEDTMPGGGRPQELINVDVDKANLFIGCLWRRWGTEAGNGKTGFQEEFERALDRRTATGEPDIWLFFKDVSDQERSDPGEQLKKVLAFQAAEEKAKRLLFQRFTDVSDWRRRISPLLHRQLLRLMTRDEKEQGASATQTQITSNVPPTTTVDIRSRSNSAVLSIASLLRTAGESLATGNVITFRDSSDFDNARSSRLLVFAAAMYGAKVQPIELGTHECNSIYFYRRTAKLTDQERLLIVRTAMLDMTVTKPGWFWTVRWKTPISTWLSWFIRSDRDDRARAMALDFANQIGFALVGPATGRAIYAALQDTSLAVRFAALRYLNSHGRPPAIRHIRSLENDSDRQLRDEATSTIISIRMRATPEKEFRRMLGTSLTLTDTLLAAFDSNTRRVATGLLLRYLEHSSPALRLRAASELQRRREMPLPAALQLTSDDSRLVREKAFFSLIDHDAAPTPAEIRTQLAEHPSSLFSGFGQTANSDAVIAYYFSKQPQEQLWRYVRLMDGNSALAMHALGHRFFTQSATAIRDSLTEDLDSYVVEAKAQRDQRDLGIRLYLPSFGPDPIEEERGRVRTAALASLALQPVSSDRGLFKRYLSSELSAVNQTIACLRGLSHVGIEEDIAEVKPLLSTASVSVRAAAARTQLLLSSNHIAAVKELLLKPSPPIVFVIVALALAARDKSVWAELEPLLKNDAEDIRRLVCHYATAILSRRELTGLLNDYAKSGWYYYNVMTLLDRALYARPNIRRHFRSQEISHFRKLSDDVTRGWPGLPL